MADRIQNRLQASASMAHVGGQGEAEIPMTDASATRSAPQPQTVQPPRVQRRVCTCCMVVDEEDVTPIMVVGREDITPMIVVESDSDSGSMEEDGDYEEDSGSDEEDDDYEEDVGAEEDDVSEPDARGKRPVVLNDPDVLDCPICLDPLSSPIYQCQNGHIACSSCSRNSNNKCPSCGLQIGFNRCRIMEKITESATVDCENKEYGCTAPPLIYNKKWEHEETCPYTLCFCPLSSCDYASTSQNLYDHFRTCHPFSSTPFTFDTSFPISIRRGQKRMILQEENEGVIFIINHEIQDHGRVFNVDCLGPNSFKYGFECMLTVGCTDICYSVEIVPDVCAQWEPHTPTRKILTIPSEFLQFLIEVCIKKA